MQSLPSFMIVADPNVDAIAVKEARSKGVKVIGILDSNSNPDAVDFGIPANDDSAKSITLIMTILGWRNRYCSWWKSLNLLTKEMTKLYCLSSKQTEFKIQDLLTKEEAFEQTGAQTVRNVKKTTTSAEVTE